MAMNESADWTQRTCFLPPIPEMDEAADMLSSAADALLSGDLEAAVSFLRKADIPAVQQFARRLQGPNDPDVHQVRVVPGAPPRLGKRERLVQRMPGKSAQDQIFERDGWRCRFCGCRVVWPRAHQAFAERLPAGAVRWGDKAIERHGAFDALTASLDHILPHSRGGDNSEANLVTACQSCQYGRGQLTLEEVGISDPREREPVRDGWDGLTRLRGPHFKLGQ